MADRDAAITGAGEGPLRNPARLSFARRPDPHETRVPSGQVIAEQRLDETEIGAGTTVTFIDAKWPASLSERAPPSGIAARLGFDPNAGGLAGWDVYDAVLTPGDLILMTVWKTAADAARFAKSVALPEGRRLRHVRVMRDCGMFDRREAPKLSRRRAPAQRRMIRSP